MTNFNGNVGLLTSAHAARLNVELARRIRAHTGRKVFLYVTGKESVRNHRRYVEEGCIDDVIDCGLFHQAALNAPSDEAAIFARARDTERRIGCLYNHLFMARREAGPGFALGGYYHPRSYFSRHATYAQLVHGLNETLGFWFDELSRRGIGLFLNGTKEITVVCRSLGIPFRSIYPTRYKNYHYWARDEFFEFPDLRRAYETTSKAAGEAITLSEPYKREVESRKKFMGENGIIRLLSKWWMVAIRNLYLRAKGYCGPQTYELKELLRYHWHVYRTGKDLRPPYAVSYKTIKGRPFVFFPLQTEPEFSLQVMSPEYFCQLAAIGSLARDLPAGVMLAVKETVWGMGRRPRDFYDQIKAFKNVVLLEVMERGVDVVNASTAVATISGSAGIEAALSGKPVILFGRHNGYQFLPHVFPVTREEDLRPALDKVFNGAVDADEARRAGVRFAEALKRISFDMRHFMAFEPESVTEPDVETMMHALFDSLAAEPALAAEDPAGASARPQPEEKGRQHEQRQ